MLIPHFGPLFRLSAETKARACVGGAARSRKSNPLIGTRNGFLFLPIGSPSDLTFPAQESRRETRAIARDSTRPIIQDRTECDVHISRAFFRGSPLRRRSRGGLAPAIIIISPFFRSHFVRPRSDRGYQLSLAATQLASNYSLVQVSTPVPATPLRFPDFPRSVSPVPRLPRSGTIAVDHAYVTRRNPRLLSFAPSFMATRKRRDSRLIIEQRE